MDVGVCLPYMERDYGRKEILAWCRAIDGGPFTSLSTGERITGYTLEMRNLLAAAAAVTERVRIVPSLYVLPMHDPVWAAKEIATLDVISDGRVTLTVGVGGREIDYRAVGASFERRHARMDEQIARMREIWSGTPPFDGADMVGPTPVQPGGPPILAGAMGPKAMARAAQWAQGVYSFSMNGEFDETKRMFDLARNAWEKAGRSDPPRLVGGFWYSLAESAEERLRAYVHGYLKVFGDAMANGVAGAMTRHTPEAVSEAIENLRRAGSDEIFLVPTTADLTEIERVQPLLS